MWTKEMTLMMWEGTLDTLFMTLLSTFFGYLLGLPMGIALAGLQYPCEHGAVFHLRAPCGHGYFLRCVVVVYYNYYFLLVRPPAVAHYAVTHVEIVERAE